MLLKGLVGSTIQIQIFQISKSILQLMSHGKKSQRFLKFSEGGREEGRWREGGMLEIISKIPILTLGRFMRKNYGFGKILAVSLYIKELVIE